MNRPVLIVGAGGHGKVVADALEAMGREVRGFLDIDPARWGEVVNGKPVIGGDDRLPEAGTVELANGIGSIQSLATRSSVFDRLRGKGFRFVTVLHPRAVVSPTARVEEGAQIMAGAIVQTNARIGADTIVNTGAIVEHDCSVGEHVHLAPGVTLSGGVRIGNCVHVGTAACVIQGIRIDDYALVAAGAVVTRDVARSARVSGIPAREMEQ
jgi:UDP-perosamine 4-acetyltransferase